MREASYDWKSTSGQLVKFLRSLLVDAKDKQPSEIVESAADALSERLSSGESMWHRIPSDTRFPGFFVSLADHALSTAAIAAPLALELFKAGVDLSGDYDGVLAELLKDQGSLIQVVRLAALLHDIGKPGPKDHRKRGERALVELFEETELDWLKPLAKVCLRHHLGRNVPTDERPTTPLEWIVALADKVSVHDRVLTVREELKISYAAALEWLADQFRGAGPEASKSVSMIKEAVKLLRGAEKEPSEDVRLALGTASLDELRRANLALADPREYNCPIEVPSQLLALVAFEAGGIQPFVRASGARWYLSGSSSLLAIASDRIKKRVEELLGPEPIIFSTSGSLLVLAPRSLVRDLIEIFGLIEKQTHGWVSLKSSSLECGLFDLKRGHESAWSADGAEPWDRGFGGLCRLAFLTLERSRGTPDAASSGRLPSERRVLPDSLCAVCMLEEACNDLTREDLENVRILGIERIGKRCLEALRTHRGNRQRALAQYLAINLESKSVSLNESGETSEQPSFFSDVMESLKVNLGRLLKKTALPERAGLSRREIKFQFPLTFDMIFEEEGTGYAAFIKGDGDNFGLLRSFASSITDYRRISSVLRSAIYESIGAGLASVVLHRLRDALSPGEDVGKPLYLPFDIVYIGGDDFLLIMDARYVFVFLKEFRSKLISVLGRASERYEKAARELPLSVIPLGVSMGIAVAPVKSPLDLVLGVAGDLLAKAKHLSKIRRRDLPFGAEIFVALMRFEAAPTRKALEERFGDSSIRLTSWPLMGAEIFEGRHSLVGFARAMLEAGLRANDVRACTELRIERRLSTGSKITSVLREPTPEILSLYIKYKAARLKKSASGRARKESARVKALEELANWVHRTDRGVTVLRHRDLEDVMKIVENSADLLPVLSESGV